MVLTPPFGTARDAPWLSRAAEVVADLGFTLLDSHRPGPTGSHLVVALRETPTYRHFDPERIAFYAPRAARGGLVEIDRLTAARGAPRRFLWGHVHVLDRFGIENRFLGFGGILRAAELDPSTTIVDLASPGPIVRWGGHSQGSDRLAAEIGAFFGRLIVPVDFTPGAEARIDALPPEVLFAAFVIDLERRVTTFRARGLEDDGFVAWLALQRERLEADVTAWADARALLHELGLDPRD